MDRLRYAALAIALVAPTIAYRLGGTTLWAVYGISMLVCAAIALWVLYADELLVDVLRPRGFDLSAGVAPAVLLVALVTWVHLTYVAPPGEIGGLLRKCALDGVRLPRGDVHGFGRVLEWVRNEVCRGYGASLGLTGPTRGVMVALIALLEEVAWRGGVQQHLSEKLGSTRGWIVASVLYGLAHLPTGYPLVALLALVCGLLWGAIYRYRGRLTPALLSHVVFSFTLFYWQPLADFR